MKLLILAVLVVNVTVGAAMAQATGQDPHTMPKQDIVRIQSALSQAGYDTTTDGVWGSQSEAALVQFQANRALPATEGMIDHSTLSALGLPGGGTTVGTPQEQTTSQPANNKPDEHGPAASERVPSDSAGQPVWSKLRPHQGVQRRSPAAPRSTTASVDENASADQYLRDAQTALRERRIREAREALERAETRVLNSAPDTNAGTNSTVDTIERAREALGHVRYLRPDLARGGQMIDQAMSETASKSTSSLSGGQSGSTNGTNGSAGPTPPR
jgi:Putative peptidoglycan binding domain